MRTKNIILYIIICLIIIAGIAVWDSKGFYTELQYSSRYQVNLHNHVGIEISDIENIANEVLGNTRHFVQKGEIFGNMVSIVSEEISEEQKNQIVEKFNEKYEDSELTTENVEIVHIPFTRIKDVIKHFIVPGICTLVLILGYFLIRFRKFDKKSIVLKTLLIPIVAEFLMFSIMAIIRVPFGRATIALAEGLYIISILVLTCIFEEQRNKYVEEENK